MKRRAIACLAAAACILCAMPGKVYAYDVDDSLIEWDEIEDIVCARSPSYTLIMDSATDTIDLMIDGVTDDIFSLKEAISDAQAPIIREALEESLSEMGSTLRSLRYSEARLDRSLSGVRYQLVAAIKTLIISYKTLEASEELVEGEISLYEELGAAASRMESGGLAAASDTAAYERELEGARSTLRELESGAAQLKSNILMLCGYAQDEDVEIGQLPQADRDFLSSRDKEADRERYIAADASVRAASSVSGYSGDVFKYRDLARGEAEAEAAAAYGELYAALSEATVGVEAASVSARRAELLAASASRQLSLGLVGAGEYEALMLESLAARASATMAELALHQAIVNYCAALP